jgi:hypothetical protein
LMTQQSSIQWRALPAPSKNADSYCDGLHSAIFVGFVVSFLNVLSYAPAEPLPRRFDILLNATRHEISQVIPAKVAV